MSKMSHIEIDFDVHRAIEGERRGFDDSANAVLRRKFGIDVESKFTVKTDMLVVPQVEIQDRENKSHTEGWSRDGLFLPESTPLKFSYNDVTKFGKVVGDRLEIEGKTFRAPSAAVIEFCRTKDGRKTHLNGWKMLFAKIDGESTWHTLDALREAKETGDPAKKAERDKIEKLIREFKL